MFHLGFISRRRTVRSGLAVILFAMFLAPASTGAHTSKNCPAEPGQAAIVSGDTYFGANCALGSPTDLDTFTFSSGAGNTWKIVAGSTNVAYPNDICVNLNGPTGNLVTWTCSNTTAKNPAAVLIVNLTAAGTYTVVVYETKAATIDYGISLERISPAPTDGTALTLSKVVSGSVNPPSAQFAYTVYGATTGTYEVSAIMTSGAYPQNLCFSVYKPDGTAAINFACTNTTAAILTVQAPFTPTVNGTYVVVVYSAFDNDTLDYSLSVACVAGTCPTQLPICSLKDKLSYSAANGTLTMNFTVGTPDAVTWNVWLTSQNSMQLVQSISQPITEPPTTVPIPHSLSKSGKVGVLSTFTTPAKGITCSSWSMINTGTP